VGVGIFWYTTHHLLPAPGSWALIVVVATPIALVTACAATLLRTLHLLRIALAVVVSSGWRTLTGLLFALRSGRRVRDEPPTLWL
jgi:hypothetical protein